METDAVNKIELSVYLGYNIFNLDAIKLKKNKGEVGIFKKMLFFITF